MGDVAVRSVQDDVQTAQHSARDPPKSGPKGSSGA